METYVYLFVILLILLFLLFLGLIVFKNGWDTLKKLFKK